MKKILKKFLDVVTFANKKRTNDEIAHLKLVTQSFETAATASLLDLRVKVDSLDNFKAKYNAEQEALKTIHYADSRLGELNSTIIVDSIRSIQKDQRLANITIVKQANRINELEKLVTQLSKPDTDNSVVLKAVKDTIILVQNHRKQMSEMVVVKDANPLPVTELASLAELAKIEIAEAKPSVTVTDKVAEQPTAQVTKSEPEQVGNSWNADAALKAASEHPEADVPCVAKKGFFEDMSTAKKVFVGAAGIAATARIVFCGYKYYQSRKDTGNVVVTNNGIGG